MTDTQITAVLFLALGLYSGYLIGLCHDDIARWIDSLTSCAPDAIAKPSTLPDGSPVAQEPNGSNT